jgi:hypothetical protein
MGYLTALAKSDIIGVLNYAERNVAEKLSDLHYAC